MASKRPDSTTIERSEHYGELQQIVNKLFDGRPRDYRVRRLDVIMAVELADLPQDLQEIAALLPPGEYTRIRLCDQLNSSISGHAWGQVYGTVE